MALLHLQALFLLQDVREAHMPRIRRFVQRVMDSDMDISAMVEVRPCLRR